MSSQYQQAQTKKIGIGCNTSCKSIKNKLSGANNAAINELIDIFAPEKGRYILKKDSYEYKDHNTCSSILLERINKLGKKALDNFVLLLNKSNNIKEDVNKVVKILYTTEK